MIAKKSTTNVSTDTTSSKPVPTSPAKTSRAISKKPAGKDSTAKKAATSKAPAAMKPGKIEAPKKAGKTDKAIKLAEEASKKKTPKFSRGDNDRKTAKVLESSVAYQGKLFRVLQEHIIEPSGKESYKDVIRHNGSVVILAVEPGKHKKDPWLVIERQYRHAAGRYLWELPAGKLDAGESALEGAKRELAEETGYGAKKWSQLVKYFASPGFLGEAMKVFLAESLIAGDAHPEEDEEIDFRLVKLSEVLELIDKGEIQDGKTLTSILLYARQLGVKRKK